MNIKRSDYARILESIIDNSVDFGVLSLPVTDTRLTVVLIHRDELILISPPHHALGKMKSATIADASKFPLIVPKAGHTRDAIEHLFHERRLKPNFTMELDSSELLKRFVAADVGIGFIARSNVEEDVRAKVLSAIPLADAQVRRDLALVFRKDKALSRAALAFIDIAVKHKSTQELVPHPNSMTKAISRLGLVLWLASCLPGLGQTSSSAKSLSQASPSARQLIAIKVTGSKRFHEDAIATATGLQMGTQVNDDDFKKAARRLGDTGVFTDIAYTFSFSSAGTKLEFQVTDAAKFVPARFEDFVWFYRCRTAPSHPGAFAAV